MNYFDISKTVQAEDSDDNLLKTHESVPLKCVTKRTVENTTYAQRLYYYIWATKVQVISI